MNQEPLSNTSWDSTVKTFVLYYGYGKEKGLSQYDLIIVEPESHNVKQLNILKQNGAKVLAYLSLVEVIPESPMAEGLQREDFLQTDQGRILMNPSYGNFLADLRSADWFKRLIHRVEDLLELRDYDGLILDTIGNLESSELIQRYSFSLHEAYRAFLIQIKEQYPQKLMIQNSGLDTVLSYSKDFIDGICWENPPIGNLEAQEWTTAVTDKLKEIQKSKPEFLVLILEESHGKQRKIHSFAQKNQWVYCKGKKDYL